MTFTNTHYTRLRNMESANKVVDAYIIQFKDDIREKMNALELITKETSDEQRDRVRELLEFIYEYPKLVLTKQDLTSTKSKKPLPASDAASVTNVVTSVTTSVAIPDDQICVAKRSDGVQCTRKKKKNCDYCGTHAKIEQVQAENSRINASMSSTQKMEISAEDIDGIIYYIDKYDNVYHTEDIMDAKENPRIIAKAVKMGDNTYKIPDFMV